jgi:hypothetical protein
MIRVLSISLLLITSASAQSNTVPVLGQWEGESICTIKDSPCHDEHVIYRVSQDAKQPEKLAIAAYKVVNGKELYMGDIDCRFAPEASELRCHYKPTDSWIYKLSGDTMKGTLTINGNTLYRNISVKRVPETAVKQ